MNLFNNERFYVRYLRREDLPGFYDMQSNPRVMRYVKPVMNYEESKRELDRFISYYTDQSLYFKIWAVIHQASETFMGICGVYLNEAQELEVAYRLREACWGKGYGGEIAEQLLAYCFDVLKHEELTAYVIEGNAGSQRILDRLMTFEYKTYDENHEKIECIYKLTRRAYDTNKNVSSQ